MKAATEGAGQQGWGFQFVRCREGISPVSPAGSHWVGAGFGCWYRLRRCSVPEALVQAPFWQAGFLTKPKQFPPDHPYLAVVLGSLCMRPDVWLFSCLSPFFLACVWAGALLYWDLPSPNSC